MTWKSRWTTLRRVGPAQVLLARTWVLLGADERVKSRYRLDESDLVVDVGAFRGDFVADVRSRWGSSVLAIEPIPEFAEELHERFRDDDRVEILQAALGDKEGSISIDQAGDASSSWTPRDPGEQKPQMVHVPLVDVAIVIGANQVGLMEINAEGAEFEILNRLLDTGQISQVRCLQIQFHRFVPLASEKRRDLRRRLKQTHRCSWSVPWVWEQWVLLEGG